MTPLRKPSGRNTISVARLDPVSGCMNARAAGSTAPLPAAVPSLPRAPARRAICSTMTITSSISSPTAAAMPPSVMMLKLIPSTLSSSTDVASVAGTTRTAISVTRQLRRKASSTAPASTSPISTASRTLLADCVTSSLWSYQLTSFTPGGSANPASRSRTAPAICTALPSGCS